MVDNLFFVFYDWTKVLRLIFLVDFLLSIVDILLL